MTIDSVSQTRCAISHWRDSTLEALLARPEQRPLLPLTEKEARAVQELCSNSIPLDIFQKICGHLNTEQASVMTLIRYENMPKSQREVPSEAERLPETLLPQNLFFEPEKDKTEERLVLSALKACQVINPVLIERKALHHLELLYPEVPSITKEFYLEHMIQWLHTNSPITSLRAIHFHPQSWMRLTLGSLEEITLNCCKLPREFKPKNLPKLRKLYLLNALAMEYLTLPKTSPELREVHVLGNMNLRVVRIAKEVSNLEKLEITLSEKVQILKGLNHSKATIKILNIPFDQLPPFPLHLFQKIERLSTLDSEMLRELPNLPKLSTVILSIDVPRELEGISNIAEIRHLHLQLDRNYQGNLPSLNPLIHLENLTLIIRNNRAVDISPTYDIPRLKVLNIIPHTARLIIPPLPEGRNLTILKN